MQITLTPQRSDENLSISKAGDVLTVNGEAFDFSGVTEGNPISQDTVDRAWLASDITRVGGVLHLTIRLPHSAKASSAVRYPSPITVSADGPVSLPTDGS